MSYQSPISLADQQISSLEIKQQLEQFSQYQKNAFLNHEQSVENLVHERSTYMDSILNRLWDYFGFSQVPSLSLVAVGGYGRSELHPLSDIDILILSQKKITDDVNKKISSFITLLWDLHLEIGHSVRTLKECIKVGKSDLTVATNLQELDTYAVANKPLSN